MDKDIEMTGTLYDMNKIAMEKLGHQMTKEELRAAKAKIVDFFGNPASGYFMLLCHERRDYTLFVIDEIADRVLRADTLLNEVLPNRGRILSIEKTPRQDAFEIWVGPHHEVQPCVYYLFPADEMVIDE